MWLFGFKLKFWWVLSAFEEKTIFAMKTVRIWSNSSVFVENCGGDGVELFQDHFWRRALIILSLKLSYVEAIE